jgi:hypothetical protein
MIEMAIWCNICSSEQAVIPIQAEINGEWIEIDVGPECLTRMERDGKIDM